MLLFSADFTNTFSTIPSSLYSFTFLYLMSTCFIWLMAVFFYNLRDCHPLMTVENEDQLSFIDFFNSLISHFTCESAKQLGFTLASSPKIVPDLWMIEPERSVSDRDSELMKYLASYFNYSVIESEKMLALSTCMEGDLCDSLPFLKFNTWLVRE